MLFGSRKFKKYRLMTPGPVPLPPDVRKMLAQPMLHHRTPEFEKTLFSALEKLKAAFQTQQPVYIHTSTGSGAMESAIVNTLSPGDEVIAVVSGKFGERWAQIAERFGVKAHLLEVPWGEACRPEMVERALQQNPRAKAVLCQASETSTATVHPIRDIAQVVARRPDTLFMVDGITAIGAMDMLMDEWKIDVLVSGSQKAFMLPTGLSFIALSEDAWKMAKTAKCPRFYFDLDQEKKALEKGGTFFSSAVAHIRALDVALDNLTGENLNCAIIRSNLMAYTTREAAKLLGLTIFSKAPSSAVTAICVPEGIDGVALRKHLEDKYNVTVMGGQDQLKGKILRIGHLGYITDEDLSVTFEALVHSLVDLGYQGFDRGKADEVSQFVEGCLKEFKP